MSLNPIARFYRYRLSNFAARLRRDKGEAFYLTGLSLFAAILVYGLILGKVEAAAAVIREHLTAVKAILPIALSVGAIATGYINGPAKLMRKWISEVWAVLPVSPQAIHDWTLAATMAIDLLWILLGVVLTTDIALTLHISWWTEFGGAMLATIILVFGASISKVLAVISMRCAEWQSAGMRDGIAGMVALTILQTFAIPYAVAASDIMHTGVVAFGALLVCGAGFAAALVYVGRMLAVRKWKVIAASFEESQYKMAKSVSSLTGVTRFVQRAKSPVRRLTALYILKARSRIGAMRFYTLLSALVTTGIILPLFFVAAWELKLAVFLGIAGGLRAYMLFDKTVGDIAPLHRLFQPLPMTFRRTAWGLATVPLIMSAIAFGLMLVYGVFLGWSGFIATLLFGLAAFLSLAPLHYFIVLSYPESRRMTVRDLLIIFAFLALISVEAPVAVLPVGLIFALVYMRKARLFWERGAVMVFAPQGVVARES